MVTEDFIASQVEEKFKEEEFRDYFLVDIEVKGNKKVSVYIDSKEGVSFGICKKLSRFLEEKIETENLMDERYTLEVSSPGTDRPLKYLKQFNKHIGRKLKVTTLEGDEVEGKLQEIAGNIIVLETGGKDKNKRGKNQPLKKIEINFESIDTAVVLVSF